MANFSCFHLELNAISTCSVKATSDAIRHNTSQIFVKFLDKYKLFF